MNPLGHYSNHDLQGSLMRSGRARAATKALVLVGLTLALSACTASAASVSFAPAFSNNLLGEGGSFTAPFTFSGTEYFGAVDPITEVTVHLPAGIGGDSSGFAVCPMATLQLTGLMGCPPGSLAGPVTSGGIEADIDSTLITEAVTSQAIYTDSGLVFYVEGHIPVAIEFMLPAHEVPDASPYGRALVVNIPTLPTVPGGPNISFTSLDPAVGAAAQSGGSTAHNVVIPSQCASGFAWAGDVRFEDGTESHVTAATGCPGAAAPSLSTTVDTGGLLQLTSFTDNPPGNQDEYAATIDWGDGSSPSVGTVVQGGSRETGGSASTFFVSGAHTYLKSDNYAVTITITKGGQPLLTRTLLLVADPTRFVVEAKSWIPQPEVVDPEVPFDQFPAVYSPQTPACTFPNVFFLKGAYLLGTSITSRFNGNDHAGFDGSFKVDMPLEIEWDGRSITHFGVGGIPSVPTVNKGHIGTTHQLITQYSPDGEHHCVEERTAADDVGTQNTGAGGNNFSAEYSVGDPLVHPLGLGAPPIHVIVTGSIAADGTLALHFQHTLFPSQGVKVTRDTLVRANDVYSDASCLSNTDVLGLQGAVTLLAGLSETANDTLTVPPFGVAAGDPQATASKICDAGYVVTDPLPPANQALIARATSSRSHLSSQEAVSIAPVNEQTGKPGAPMSVATAVARHLAIVSVDSAGEPMLITPLQPQIAVEVSGRHVAFASGVLEPGRPETPSYYGPLSGSLTIVGTSGGVRVAAGRRVVKPRRPVRAPPVTRVRATVRGHRVTLRFTVRDRAGVFATYVILANKRQVVRHGRIVLHVQRRQKIGYYSVDVFGNAERPRQIIG